MDLICKLVLIWFLLFPNKFTAQDTMPVMNLSGRTIESFVPDGWNIISNSEGDINLDKLNDVAIVIEKTLQILKQGDSVPSDVTKRILSIFVKRKEGTYFKTLQSDTFIIAKEGLMSEPFQGIAITDRGELEINFQIWKEKSKWFVSNHSYKFLLQNNKLDLVQYDSNETNRETGNSTDYSIDFLLKKMSIQNYNFKNEKPPTSENRKFKLDFIKNIETLKEPFQWEFQGLMI